MDSLCCNFLVQWSATAFSISLRYTCIWKKQSSSARGSCTPMFIAALLTVAKIWKQTMCLSTDEWRKMWFITHTHTHTQTQWRRKETLFEKIGMNPEDIMLSGISQWKTKTVWSCLFVESLFFKLIHKNRTEWCLPGPESWEERWMWEDGKC